MIQPGANKQMTAINTFTFTLNGNPLPINLPVNFNFLSGGNLKVPAAVVAGDDVTACPVLFSFTAKVDGKPVAYQGNLITTLLVLNQCFTGNEMEFVGFDSVVQLTDNKPTVNATSLASEPKQASVVNKEDEPVVLDSSADLYDNGFRGFLTKFAVMPDIVKPTAKATEEAVAA